MLAIFKIDWLHFAAPSPMLVLSPNQHADMISGYTLLRLPLCWYFLPTNMLT